MTRGAPATDGPERKRLSDQRSRGGGWRKWGPYLSERQWGTVREDYSETGCAWDYFTHDQARSRAYRWGEDGIAGICDDQQQLCFAVAFWNGVDSILKERLFGLTNAEGNHGEDVKEYYYYLDSTPTHSYMKYLYKYPQAPYPYSDLVVTNRDRGRERQEYELIDTGVFEHDRYFDIFIEYAKQNPEEMFIRIQVRNRGPDAAILHVLPTLWFRNTWSWVPDTVKPFLQQVRSSAGMSVIAAFHPSLGDRYLYCDGDVPLLFTENETNNERIFHTSNASPYVKDGINNYLVNGQANAINPVQLGTKASAYYSLAIEPEDAKIIQLRLTRETPQSGRVFFDSDFEATLRTRKDEADQFYASITPASLTADQAMVMRQALAGMLWSKQYYHFDLDLWLEGHGYNPSNPGRILPRNCQWYHMLNDDVISMPDKWEYPWYAAWDLAFHAVALGMVDLDFAKGQLDTILQEVYQHPNGQIPACEWNFGDVNPPVHAWATLMLYSTEKAERGKGDRAFLESSFRKLLLNFTWWVNRKDAAGNNLFEGGFLGLDNIGVFDRSAPLPAGGYIEPADSTAWMAMYCQNMLAIAIELAMDDPSYETLACKFAEHFLWLAGAMDRVGISQDELWDEEDGFFYDVLRLPDGSAMRLKVRSLVGLLPLCATTVIPQEFLSRFPGFLARIERFFGRRPELLANLPSPDKPGLAGRRLLAVLNESKLRRVLARMLDENRFLSPHGIRSLSKWHLDHPCEFQVHGQTYEVRYMPAESTNGMFGGNSNWRGPVWFPINMLIIRGLLMFYEYYGDSFKVECPTGSGVQMTLYEIAREISNRLTSIFLQDQSGRRPVFGGNEKFQADPQWRDYLLFYEYFHGENGAGLGASHQTGWTGIVARLLRLFAPVHHEDFLQEDSDRVLQVGSR